MKLLRSGLWAILSLCPVLSSAPLLQLLPPSGAVSGAPGSTVGWGFTITNPTNFLVVTGSDFCEGAVVSPCPHTIGTYTDYIGAFNFIVVGPAPESPVVSQPFSLAAMTGVGSFQINGTSHAGDVASGQVRVSYDLYRTSPNDLNFDPSVDTISTGNVLTATARVAVTVPEPASLGVIGITLMGLAALKRRRRALLRGDVDATLQLLSGPPTRT